MMISNMTLMLYDDDDDYGQYDDFEDNFEFEVGAQPYMFEPLA